MPMKHAMRGKCWCREKHDKKGDALTLNTRDIPAVTEGAPAFGAKRKPGKPKVGGQRIILNGGRKKKNDSGKQD